MTHLGMYCTLVVLIFGCSKIELLEDLCNLVDSVCAKFEGCAAKTVEVGFF